MAETHRHSPDFFGSITDRAEVTLEIEKDIDAVIAQGRSLMKKIMGEKYDEDKLRINIDKRIGFVKFTHNHTSNSSSSRPTPTPTPISDISTTSKPDTSIKKSDGGEEKKEVKSDHKQPGFIKRTWAKKWNIAGGAALGTLFMPGLGTIIGGYIGGKDKNKSN